MYRYYPASRSRQPTLSPLVEEQFAPLASMEDISLSNATPLSSPNITPPPSTKRAPPLEGIPEEKIERRYSRRPRFNKKDDDHSDTASFSNIIVQTLPVLEHPIQTNKAKYKSRSLEDPQTAPFLFIQPRRERIKDLRRYCYAPLSQSPGVDLEVESPPKDRLSLIYLTLILHGIGTQMSWNMFVTAKEQNRGDWFFMLSQYFVTYKLGKDYTNINNDESRYAMHFLQYFSYAAQVPNLILNWINIFINWGENLTMRIVWTILIEVFVFVITIVLAMVDSSNWPGLFFYLTMASVVLLNAANGIYHNTVYGMASKLPFQYAGAVILGSNISGIIVATINIISIAIAPNPRTAAIYYFITALFILLACFDTYFALPLNRFFRYHDYQYKKGLQLRHKSAISSGAGHGTNPSSRTSSLVRRFNRFPFWTIFRKCLPQCFNIFFTFFVSLTIFPNVYAEVHRSDQTFFISKKYYSAITCFLTFHFGAILGNIIATYVHFPSPRWLFAPVLLRALFIPFFALCNYRPLGVERIWPVMFHWDVVYWTGGAFFGLTGGYLSAIAIMYCPRSVEPEYAATAGMFGASSIVTGIISGIAMSYSMPILVSSPELQFELPSWWPQFIPN